VCLRSLASDGLEEEGRRGVEHFGERKRVMGKDAFDGSKENASRFLLFLVLRNRFFPLCSLPFSSCSLLLHRQTFFHALDFLFAHLASLFRPIDFAKIPHYRAPPCIFAPFHTVAFGSPSDHVRRSEG
jgi:hypothetical protein